MLELNKIYNEDCLEGMNRIPDKSIDMILTDLPYGTTKFKWDSIIPLDKLWKHYKRIIKDNGAIVLTCKQPFTSNLIMSNIGMYRYNWVWKKTRPQRFVQAKKMPLSYYEDIAVFYKKLPTYNPQMVEGKPYVKKHVNTTKGVVQGEEKRNGTVTKNSGTRYPSDVIEIPNSNYKSMHPTQKPVDLFEYLIKTYTNEDDVVLDTCMGSGTTAIACLNTERNYIGFELEKEYYDLANERIEKHKLEKFNE